MMLEERKLKKEIFNLYFPLKINIQFNKLIVIICIFAIISYVTAAILLQKCTNMELSPTLTTCVFAFFGTELLGLVGIKVMDTKFGANNAEFYDENENNVV